MLFLTRSPATSLEEGVPRARKTWPTTRLLAVMLPLGLTLFVFGWVVPSRLEGGQQGLVALVARIGDQHPLILAIGLFLLFSELSNYWRGRLASASGTSGPGPGTAPSRRRPFLGSRPAALRLALLLVGLAAVTFVARASVFAIYRVDGASMVPTVNSRDRVLVNRLAYRLVLPFGKRITWGTPPRRGDVIVFSGEAPEDSGGQPKERLKRILGLPGDVVAFRDGFPIINGWPVPACDAGPFVYAAGTTTVRGRLAVEFLDDRAFLTVRTPLDESSFSAYKVLPGEVFVIGDDRALSSDSRAWNGGKGGGVRMDAIQGRVSRLVVGGFSDGRLDLASVLAPLGPKLRVSGVDLTKTYERIAACLKNPPVSTRPPSPR